MTTIKDTHDPVSNRRKIILGTILLVCSMICILMTIIFLYVSHTANKRVEEIRKDYWEMATRRDDRVDALTTQVTALQQKLDAIPERTADKTVIKVKEVVVDGELPPVKANAKP